MMVVGMVAAGTMGAKILKASILVAAVDLARSSTAFAAEISVDPPTNVGDFVTTAAQEGLAFSLAVLFVVLLITRRIKVVDPDEVKALDEMKRTVESSQSKITALEKTLDAQTQNIDKLVDVVRVATTKVEAVHQEIR